MTPLIGFIGAFLSGILLGLLGGGGSIVTVPILVYLFHLEPVHATGYSLFIVGISSLLGSIRYFVERNVNFRIALVFGLPSFICVYSTRKFLLPVLPDVLLTINNFVITKNLALMMALSVLMIATSFYIIYHDGRKATLTSEESIRYARLAMQGAVVGIITGLVGIGGGFLIVPALIIFARLPMRMAVGTSLLLIAVNSAFGFAGQVMSASPIEWPLLLRVTAATMLGVFTGIFISKFIPGEKLKPVFGWFILLVGAYILTMEVWKEIGV